MKKEISGSTMVFLAMGQIGKIIYAVIFGNFLMFFFVPKATSTIPMFLPQAALWFSIIRGISMVFDAVTDPYIASLSDKSKGKYGRRITFMRYAAIPYCIFCISVFLVPFKAGSSLNVVWLAVTLLAYYFFSTLYNIPYKALIPEVIRDTNKRTSFYVISGVFQTAGLILAAFIPTIKNVFRDSFGLSTVHAWQLTFGILCLIGGICSLIPTFVIKEKEYAEEATYSKPVFKSIKEVFKIKPYKILFISGLFSGTSGAFFNAGLMYYITMLLGLDDSFFTVIMLISLATTLVSYPIVKRILPKTGKKALMITSSIMLSFIYLMTFMGTGLVQIINPKIIGIALGLLYGFPTVVWDVVVPGAYADICHYDRIVSKQSRAGILLASKNFLDKFRQSAVGLIIPLVITIGSLDGKATYTGVIATGVIAFIVCVTAMLIIIKYFDDKEIQRVIRADQ